MDCQLVEIRKHLALVINKKAQKETQTKNLSNNEEKVYRKEICQSVVADQLLAIEMVTLKKECIKIACAGFENICINDICFKLEDKLKISKVDLVKTVFNNVETFFRCLDIFKKFYKKETGKSIDCDLSYSMPHVPLQGFCDAYISQFPVLAKMEIQEREKFIRLISVFTVGSDVVDWNITLTIKINLKGSDTENYSFKPIIKEKFVEKKGIQ